MLATYLIVVFFLKLMIFFLLFSQILAILSDSFLDIHITLLNFQLSFFLFNKVLVRLSVVVSKIYGLSKLIKCEKWKRASASILSFIHYDLFFGIEFPGRNLFHFIEFTALKLIIHIICSICLKYSLLVDCTKMKIFGFYFWIKLFITNLIREKSIFSFVWMLLDNSVISLWHKYMIKIKHIDDFKYWHNDPDCS